MYPAKICNAYITHRAHTQVHFSMPQNHINGTKLYGLAAYRINCNTLRDSLFSQ